MAIKKIIYHKGEPILVESNIMRVGRSPHKLAVPAERDQDLAYLCGYHLGDGYLEDVEKTFRRTGKGDYEVCYADSDLDQILLIDNIIKDKFRHKLGISKRPGKRLWIGKTTSKCLHWYLNQVLAIPDGRKLNISIPLWIVNNDVLFSHFLGGFFDAEGDVSRNRNRAHNGKIYFKIRLQITQKERYILNEIKQILEERFYIRSCIFKKNKKDAYILKIDARNSVNVFKERIWIRHRRKRDKLSALSKAIEYKQPRKIKTYFST